MKNELYHTLKAADGVIGTSLALTDDQPWNPEVVAIEQGTCAHPDGTFVEYQRVELRVRE